MSASSIRAVIDTLEKIPASRFGPGRARILRKLVLVSIAKHADADGSNAEPSTATLARICLVGERAIREIVEWLKEEKLLRVEYKAGRHGCNRYAIQFHAPGIAVPGRPGIAVPGTPGTIHAVPGTAVPRDPAIENAPLPSFTERRETGKAPLSFLPGDPETDAIFVETRIWQAGFMLSTKIKQAIRARLQQGVTRETLIRAVDSLQANMPRTERNPGLYLMQNFEGEVDAVLRGWTRAASRDPGPPRRAPDYLKEPPRGPLTGKEKEDHEKDMAALARTLGVATPAPKAASAAA